VSDDFFTGYDILKHGEHDNEALSQTAITFAATPECGSIHEELDPTPHLRIENQGSWPSCTGHAMTTVMECIAGLQAGRWEEIPQLSRKFMWEAGQKEWTGRINWKEGCTIAHVVKAAMEFGCCPESVAPYDFKASSLTTQAFREALKIKALNQVEIPDYESAKRFLDGGYGAIVAGVNWTSSMSSCPGVMTENMVRSGRSVGGHAVPFVGFRRNGNLLLPNSWGSSYANNGVAEVTPDAFDWLCSQAYTVMRGITDLTGFDKTRQLESWGMG
jgi:hypothetical protein